MFMFCSILMRRIKLEKVLKIKIKHSWISHKLEYYWNKNPILSLLRSHNLVFTPPPSFYDKLSSRKDPNLSSKSGDIFTSLFHCSLSTKQFIFEESLERISALQKGILEITWLFMQTTIPSTWLDPKINHFMADKPICFICVHVLLLKMTRPKFHTPLIQIAALM